MAHGRATFVDEHRIEVADEHGGCQQYSADIFVLATGSRPYHPPGIDFAHPRIHDSNTILTLDSTPRSVTVYGAGVIGCEYASIFRNLDMKVNLVNTRERLLEYLDDEISSALSYYMRDEQGVLIRQNEEYERVEVNDDGVVLHLKTGKVIKSDMLLWANGRTGNSAAMGLEALGIEPDHRGNIAVNETYQTVQPHIYAVGDAAEYVFAPTGKSMRVPLAGPANRAGRIAGEQSSRNWGWIRVQGRDLAEIPIAQEAQRLWQGLAQQVGQAAGT